MSEVIGGGIVKPTKEYVVGVGWRGCDIPMPTDATHIHVTMPDGATDSREIKGETVATELIRPIVESLLDGKLGEAMSDGTFTVRQMEKAQ